VAAPQPAAVAAQPGLPADPDELLRMMGTHLDSAAPTVSDVDGSIAKNIAAARHVSALLQRKTISHQDVVSGAIDAVGAGAITNDQATAFIERMRGEPPHQLRAKLQEVMTMLGASSVALSGFKHRQAAGGRVAANAAPPGRQQG